MSKEIQQIYKLFRQKRLLFSVSGLSLLGWPTVTYAYNRYMVSPVHWPDPNSFIILEPIH